MAETVIVALVAGLASVIGAWIAGNKTQAVIQTRIDILEKKVEKHNNLIERVYKLEQKVEDLVK